jgi:hypothetical protein
MPRGQGHVEITDINGDGFEDVLLHREDRAWPPEPRVPNDGQYNPLAERPVVGYVRQENLWQMGYFGAWRSPKDYAPPNPMGPVRQ